MFSIKTTTPHLNKHMHKIYMHVSIREYLDHTYIYTHHSNNSAYHARPVLDCSCNNPQSARPMLRASSIVLGFTLGNPNAILKP